MTGGVGRGNEMVGEILYFLHRHVRIATPLALVLLFAAGAGALNVLGHMWAAVFG
ncbi:hypothetical protein ACO2Q1_10090 [Brevundimonas sp. VNH65]|uniref:hypothetical protein n=1 Tax=Brevundimonas sp. VNH65 TaxID=3400917 RepID=UPI003BFAE94D